MTVTQNSREIHHVFERATWIRIALKSFYKKRDTLLIVCIALKHHPRNCIKKILKELTTYGGTSYQGMEYFLQSHPCQPLSWFPTLLSLSQKEAFCAENENRKKQEQLVKTFPSTFLQGPSTPAFPGLIHELSWEVIPNTGASHTPTAELK